VFALSLGDIILRIDLFIREFGRMIADGNFDTRRVVKYGGPSRPNTPQFLTNRHASELLIRSVRLGLLPNTGIPIACKPHQASG
jgi:hypothetical protein